MIFLLNWKLKKVLKKILSFCVWYRNLLFIFNTVQRQFPEAVLKNRCLEIFHKIPWNTLFAEYFSCKMKASKTLSREISSESCHIIQNNFSLELLCKAFCGIIWWWIVFVVWLTDERCLALFPAWTVFRDPHHLESLTLREQDLNCVEPEFKLCWMKLCSSDNRYTTSLFYFYSRCFPYVQVITLQRHWNES